MPRAANTVCPCTGTCGTHTGNCPTITPGGRCPACTTAHEQRRGTAHSRGYGHHHRTRFREQVLARDPYCKLRLDGCQGLSTDADHHPLTRRQLVDAGLDPNDPKHGRGLCHRCHSRETATHQPGGWNSDGE